MGNITITHTFADDTVAEPGEVNENFTDITDVVNGDIDNTNIASDAAIAGSKLNLATPGAIGGTTPAAGAFTTLAASSTLAVTGATTLSSTLGVTGVTTLKKTVQTVTAYTPDAAGTATLDLTTGNIHSITMPAGNITIAISNETAGQCFIIEITQDSVGSRTVTWFSTIRWFDTAPTLTTTASKRDTFGFRVTGTDTYDGYIIGQGG